MGKVICKVVSVFVNHVDQFMRCKRIFLDQERTGGLGENILSRKVLMQLSIREIG